jgi:hypothetical protein
VYHVEISQDSTRVRAFNLTAEQVHQRFLTPLRGDRRFVCEDKEFDPSLAALRVLEGPELRIDQLTLGRGWSEAERIGTDVSSQFRAATSTTAAPQPERGARSALKDRIVGRVSAGPVTLAELPALAADLMPGARASEQLAETELAVWELLHQEQLLIGSAGAELPRGEWERAVLDAGSWFGPRSVTVTAA